MAEAHPQQGNPAGVNLANRFEQLPRAVLVTPFTDMIPVDAVRLDDSRTLNRLQAEVAVLNGEPSK